MISSSAGELTLEPGCCLLLPSLKGKTKAVVGEYFHSRNVRVHNITPTLNAPWYSNGRPSYGPWWWLWSGETLAGLVEAANFRVLDVMETWKGLAHVVFAEKVK